MLGTGFTRAPQGYSHAEAATLTRYVFAQNPRST